MKSTTPPTEGENVQQWQQDAIRALENARNPGVSLPVLKRTLENATRRAVVKIIPGSWKRDATVERESRRADGRDELIRAELPRQCASIEDALQFADTLDRRLPERCKNREDYYWLMSIRASGKQMIAILSKHFGDEVNDLCHALLTCINDEPRTPPQADALQTIRELFQPKCHEEVPVLSMMLGRRQCIRLLRRHETIEEALDVLKRCVARSAALRQGLLDALYLFANAPDRLLASACVRQGWNELMEADAVGSDSVSIAQRMHCDFHREKLETARGQYGWVGATARQRAIIGEVYAMTCQYEHPHDKLKKSNKPGFVTSTPRHTLDRRQANCFSGPSLIAMLLIRSGFKKEQLYWCKVMEMAEGCLGSHGALIARTDGNDLIFIDHGGKIVSRDLLFQDITNRTMRNQLKSLITGTNQVVTIRNPAWKKRGIHPHMQVMPLSMGIATGHMTHVAHAAVHKNQWKVAEHAARLALSFNPQDPDALHTVGLCRLMGNNPASAERYFRQGLSAFPNHAGCLLHLGECLLQQQRTDEAIGFLDDAKRFGENTWEGQPYVERAKNLRESLQ